MPPSVFRFGAGVARHPVNPGVESLAIGKAVRTSRMNCRSCRRPRPVRLRSRYAGGRDDDRDTCTVDATAKAADVGVASCQRLGGEPTDRGALALDQLELPVKIPEQASISSR